MSAESLRTLPQLNELQQTLGERYAFHSLTIISSSKINQKVTQVLRLLRLNTSSTSNTGKEVTSNGKSATSNNGNLPSVDKSPDMGEVNMQVTAGGDAQNGSRNQELSRPEDSSTSTKPVIVAITAKADTASKLITVVEIVKREVVKQRKASREVDKSGPGIGNPVEENATLVPAKEMSIYQYCSLSGVEAPPVRPLEKKGMGTAQGAPGKKRRYDGDIDTVVDAPTKKRTQITSKENVSEESDDEVAFETFERPVKTAAPAAKDVLDDVLDLRKRHQIPILTIYLSMQPVVALTALGLKESMT